MADFDIQIKGGTIVDGTRVPRYRGDAWIRDGKVAQIGGRSPGFAKKTIDADGLIVVSDMKTGFWDFKMDGFDGWNGHQWGMPNISSAQDWDNGPEGAPKPNKVS